MVGRAPRGAVDEHLDCAAALARKALAADPLLHGDDLDEPLLLGGFGDGVGNLLAGVGAFALRVGEHEGRIEGELLEGGAGGAEVLLGLVREADDDVGRDGDLGHGGPELVNEHPELFERIATSHLREDAVGARLEREVDRVGHVGELGDGGDELIAEVDWIGRGEAYALDAGDLCDRAEEVCKVDLFVAVGVHGLAEEGELLEAHLGELVGLTEHLAGRGSTLAAAGIGDDTEGAELVAAALDGDPAGDAFGAGGRDALVGLALVEPDIEDGVALACATDKFREAAVGIGANDEVDVGGLVEDLLLEVLRHAASDADDEIGVAVLEASELRGASVDALFGLFAHGAGVHEDEIGLVESRGGLVADRGERAEDELGVGDIHLAAVGLDEDLFGAGRRLGHGGPRGGVGAGWLDSSGSGAVARNGQPSGSRSLSRSLRMRRLWGRLSRSAGRTQRPVW